jgi:hypothetical protein
MTDDGPSPPGTWTKRRRRLDLILAYCAIVAPGLLIWRPDAIVLQFSLALVAGAIGIVSVYLLGAVQDDKNARAALAARKEVA